MDANKTHDKVIIMRRIRLLRKLVGITNMFVTKRTVKTIEDLEINLHDCQQNKNGSEKEIIF